MNSPDNLEEMPTRLLMSLRSKTYLTKSCWCTPEVECEDRSFNERQISLRKRINEVLSTREHIPSKREGQALRREAAKRKV